MRLRTDIYVSALLRRAETAGAFASVVYRGNREAGAIFIHVIGHGGEHLLAPALPGLEDSDDGERGFRLLEEIEQADQIGARMASERRFDPDLWLVEISGTNPLSMFEEVLVQT